jgi:hypothetical protein
LVISRSRSAATARIKGTHLNDRIFRRPPADGIIQPAPERIGDHVIKQDKTNATTTFALHNFLLLIDNGMAQVQARRYKATGFKLASIGPPT